jgi:hypothetical protein
MASGGVVLGRGVESAGIVVGARAGGAEAGAGDSTCGVDDDDGDGSVKEERKRARPVTVDGFLPIAARKKRRGQVTFL